LKKIGVYGGTFDPIHFGHLILAREALEQLHLEQIIFVPAAQSPHKLGRVPTPVQTRLRMLQAAISDEPLFAIDDFEVNRPPPSFTIDTITELKRRTEALEVSYLIGEDNLSGLANWHRIDELRTLVHFVVLQRGEAIPATAYPTIQRRIDISATEIRNRIATGRSIRYLVPPVVEEIIRQDRLYQESTR